MDSINKTQEEIRNVCNTIRNFLIEKNWSYGDSVIHPINIFSNAPASEQLNTRIDDKLNRIRCGQEYDGDDTEKDLIGYLILKRVERNLRHERNQENSKQHCLDRTLSETKGYSQTDKLYGRFHRHYNSAHADKGVSKPGDLSLQEVVETPLRKQVCVAEQSLLRRERYGGRNSCVRRGEPNN